ncbi:MAG: oxidoreductase, partial [Bacteroidota bacterium]|nr:oxidoreductase [Bacteroidota bacterium]
AKLETLARSISKNVHQVDEQQRQWIHVAAVFANNFTNHLYGISEGILNQHGLQFDILTPLIFSSIENLSKHSPSEIQTGPAARNDVNTIEKHMMLLGDDTRLQKIYQVLTESIMNSAKSGL